MLWMIEVLQNTAGPCRIGAEVQGVMDVRRP